MNNRRPAVEYVRDVYAELMGMGEGVRRPGDRSDISSDEEDEMEVRRHSLPKTEFLETRVIVALVIFLPRVIFLLDSSAGRTSEFELFGRTPDLCSAPTRTQPERFTGTTPQLASNTPRRSFLGDRSVVAFQG